MTRSTPSPNPAPIKTVGRPPTPPELELVQKSVRMTRGQWEKIERCGGFAWLRSQVDKAKEP